jgi:hypothetical protein
MGVMMVNLDQSQFQIFPIQNQLIGSKKGPLAVRIFMDFSAQPEYDLNLQNIQANGQFDLCQTIFVDNAAGGSAVTITIGPSGTPLQTIVVRAGSQGYYNVICPNPILMQFASAGGAPCTVFLIDVAIPGATWSAI